MQPSLRPFWLVLLAVWTLLSVAAIAYSQSKDIPADTVSSLLPAFLLEAGLYLGSGIDTVRARIEQLRPAALAATLVASAVAPYTVYTFNLGIFDWRSFGTLALLAAVAAFWYVRLRPSLAADLGFLTILAAVVLAKVFALLYPEPASGRVGMAILGQAMWIRIGLVAVLSIRRMGGIGFSFIPKSRDWRIGVLHYLLFLPVGLAAGVALGFLRSPAPLGWRTLALAVATFAGILWVVALSEEFFFRGVLQQRLDELLSARWSAIVVTSVIFGLVHLGFGGRFPNWRFVILAGLASLFYGRAYAQASSIRASMVTHALVVTTWRVFL